MPGNVTNRFKLETVPMIHYVVVAVIFGCGAFFCLPNSAFSGEAPGGQAAGAVNVNDFSNLATRDDWSGAIQAAIDYVKSDNG